MSTFEERVVEALDSIAFEQKRIADADEKRNELLERDGAKRDAYLELQEQRQARQEARQRSVFDELIETKEDVSG